jgi:cell wall-associated NlpC family hydrolase
LARRTETFAVPTRNVHRVLRPLLKVFAAGGVAMVLASVLPAIAQADPPKTAAQAQAQMDALDNRAEIATEQFNAAQAQLAEAQGAAQAATRAASLAQAGLAAQRVKVSAFAVAAYTSGGVSESVLATTLGTGDPSQTLQRLATLQHLSEGQSQVLRDANAAGLRYNQALTTATQDAVTAQTIAAAVAAQKKTIDALIAQGQLVLNQLSASERAKLLTAQRAQSAIQQKQAAVALAAWNAARAARPVTRALNRPAVVTRQSVVTPVAVSSPQTASAGGGSSVAERAVAAAMSKLGARYVYGAGGARTFDCSGLVQWAYGQVGVRTAHYTGAFWSSYRHIPSDQLRPGDLVFFYRDHHHVGIYIGGGMMINAPHTGDVVRIASVFGGGRDYVGAVRVLG